MGLEARKPPTGTSSEEEERDSIHRPGLFCLEELYVAEAEAAGVVRAGVQSGQTQPSYWSQHGHAASRQSEQASPSQQKVAMSPPQNTQNEMRSQSPKTMDRMRAAQGNFFSRITVDGSSSSYQQGYVDPTLNLFKKLLLEPWEYAPVTVSYAVVRKQHCPDLSVKSTVTSARYTDGLVLCHMHVCVCLCVCV